MLDMVMPVEETIRSAALAHHLSANIAEAAGPVKRRTTQAIWHSRANPFPDRRREALTWERGASVNSDLRGPYRFDVFSRPQEVEERARAALTDLRQSLARLEKSGGEPRIWLPTLRLAIIAVERILALGFLDNHMAGEGEWDLRAHKMAEVSRALNRASAAVSMMETFAGPEWVADLRGDVRIAYRSQVDDSDQPFCLYVPEDYNPESKWPLMVRLHGMWSDIGEADWTIQTFEWDREFVRYAPRGRFIELYPWGRGNEGYWEAGLRDVFDTMALIEEWFAIDPDRVYLMGSSMGAAGAWRIAADHADRFAAMCCVVGAYDPSLVEKIAGLPVMFHYGGKDKPERVTSPIEVAEALRSVGGTVEVIGHPESGHRLETTDYQLSYYQFFAKHARR
jgi:poly(3-hydroxybutyrate) depolymerase